MAADGGSSTPNDDLRESQKKRPQSFYNTADPHSEGVLGTWGTVLAIMSTIVGGGMLSIPWAFLECGIYLAIAFAALAAIQVVYSAAMLLKARELCPQEPQSFFEIGFLTMGRPSIFWICIIILVNSFGLLIIFFGSFGSTFAQVIKELATDLDGNSIWLQPATYSIGLAILLTPFIVMKELAELKIVSIGLFTTAILFVAVNVV